MLIAILNFQNANYVLPADCDPGKLITTLATLASQYVETDYVSGVGYKYTIKPDREVQVSLTYVDSSRVQFPPEPQINLRLEDKP